MGVMKRLQYELANGRRAARGGATTARTLVRRCPIVGCEEVLRDWQLFCFAHYRLIPAEIAHRLNRARVVDDESELRFAVSEAIASVADRAGQLADQATAGLQGLLF